MTPETALIEILDRVGASQGAAALINAEELAQWPSDAVKALKAQKLIKKAQPASSALCPGCESECVMPVHVIPVASGDPVLFIVCDKRSDINRVAVSSDRLVQWKSNNYAVARFIADCLSLRLSGKRLDVEGLMEIGVAAGNKNSRMLCLRPEGELALVAGSSAIPLAEVVGFSDGRYSLDENMIRQLVDYSTTTDARHTPSNVRRKAKKLDTQAMYKSWQKEYRKLKRKRPDMSDVWYSQQIAKLDIAMRRSVYTIRKHMKPWKS